MIMRPTESTRTVTPFPHPQLSRSNPDNDGIAYLVGGNVLDGVTMRLLRLTPGGQFADLPMRSPGAPACSPDAPSPATPAARTGPCCCNSSRSEEHTSELQSLMRISYAVLCLKQNNTTHIQ